MKVAEHVKLEADLTHAELLRVFVEAAYRKGYVEGVKTGCEVNGSTVDPDYLSEGVKLLRVEWNESDDGMWALGAKFPDDKEWFEILGVPPESYAQSSITPAFTKRPE